MYVFGDCNVHHVDYLTHSSSADRPVMKLPLVAHFPTCLILASDPGFRSTISSSRPENFNHAIVWVSIEFPISLEGNAPFHHRIFDYSCANLDAFYNCIRDFSWEDFYFIWVLLLLLLKFVSGFWLKSIVSLFKNIGSSLTYLRGFLLLLLLKTISFSCINRTCLLCLRPSINKYLSPLDLFSCFSSLPYLHATLCLVG